MKKQNTIKLIDTRIDWWFTEWREVEGRSEIGKEVQTSS